jgi:NMT1/THI5 like
MIMRTVLAAAAAVLAAVANGLDRGADIVLLGEFIEERRPYASTTWMVRKDAGIEEPADLKGKTVAAIGGGSTDYLQDFYIEQKGGLKAGRDCDEVIAASAAATKIPAKALDGFLLTKQDYFRPSSGGVSLQALQNEWDFFRARRGIKQDLKVSDHVIDGLLPPAG